jgi:hypothetical protein
LEELLGVGDDHSRKRRASVVGSWLATMRRVTLWARLHGLTLA